MTGERAEAEGTYCWLGDSSGRGPVSYTHLDVYKRQGTEIDVYGNVQEATGDTMNGGAIYIHGSAGDATGYAMRGGKILIQGDTGYRAGVHMKEYKDKIPAIVVGGVAGSFLGEYQAGGVIVVLGLHRENQPIAGYFCGTGMHGGKIYLRSDTLPEGCLLYTSS